MAALARRFVTILLSTALLIGALGPAASATSHEGELLGLLNADRAAAGLAPLATHPDLVDDAAVWSQHLMAQGSLAHNPNLAAVTSSWDKLGENVGVGATIPSIHAAFMASASHRSNALGDYTHIGIAVVEETPTKLWVTVVFMKSLGSSTVEDEPVPYSEKLPTTADQQPVAAAPATTEPAPAPAPAPAARPVPSVTFVRTGAQPFAD
jgi:hypothetical protein